MSIEITVMRVPKSIIDASALSLAHMAPNLANRLLTRYGFEDRRGIRENNRVPPGSNFEFNAPLYSAQAGLNDADEAALTLHYLFVGSSRGFQPADQFDPGRYRRDNPDVGVAGYEAFSHARRFGWLEGRMGSEAKAIEPPVPTLQELLQMPRAAGESDVRPINVIIPVYKGYADVLRTIAQVIKAKNATNFDLVVVDDASPESEVRMALDALGQSGKIRLLRNERNRGFVASVNRAIALDPDRDVVLLNSDTAVFDGWLDRICRVLITHSHCGTVTPISNAATILSYPIWLKDNVLLESERPSEIDRQCQDLDFSPIEIPTAVGYCMAIRRACIEAVGPFDELTFGLGYGEENDFCRRAIQKGWINLAATNVFVWHKGGGAFGADKASRVETAQRAIERLHPGYRKLIKRFIQRDGLRDVRARLDARMINVDPRTKVLVDYSAPVPAAPDRLRLTCIPEISPYFGSYRLVALDGPRSVNFPRLKHPLTQATLAKALSEIESGVGSHTQTLA